MRSLATDGQGLLAMDGLSVVHPALSCQSWHQTVTQYAITLLPITLTTYNGTAVSPSSRRGICLLNKLAPC